ncbi:MAG TPA: hypothetical protein VMR54_01845 [Thermoanaerobaculia bacterium]|nr:hypothetical protein [Thermoanaerobaculia bacterium]
MKRSWTRATSLFLAVLLAASGLVFAQQPGSTVPNWAVPSGGYHPRGGMTTQSDVTNPVAFVGVTPCRVVRTLNPNGPFGGPALSAGSPRDFAIPLGPCAGIPANAAAYSLNITVTNTLGPGFVKVYPTGGVVPTVSTINYNGSLPPGQAIANAAIVPAGTPNGSITVVAGVSGTDLLIDINGYWGDTPGNPAGAFKLFTNSGGYTMSVQNSSASCSGACGLYANVASGDAVYGVANALNAVGVQGNHTAQGYGVVGVSAGGVGVQGTSNASGLNWAGVSGLSTNAIGTYGFSTNSNGVWAQSGAIEGLAAFGGRDGAYVEGARHGVIGVSNATTGQQWGVLGVSQSTTQAPAGVRGVDSSGYLPAVSCCLTGVLGDSQTSFGVLGRSRYAGVVGYLFDNSDNPIVFGALGFSTGLASDLTPGPWGVYSFGNFGATGSKHFVEPHPTDATRVIVYSSLEGPEVGTYLRGTTRIENGRAVISLPDHFRTVTAEEGITVQLTPVGEFASMYVESENLNEIVVRSSKDVTFHYLVQGVRRAFAGFEPVQSGNEFMPRSPEDRIPAYLTPEAKRRLIANGTYNEDGTVNMATAERAGWTRIWAERDRLTKEAAAKAASDAAKTLGPQGRPRVPDVAQ